MGRFKMLFLLLSCLMSLQLSATSPQSINLACLDSCIAVRPHSVAKVELRLSGLKQQLGFAGDDQRKRLRLLHEIYHIYYTYQFDSALAEAALLLVEHRGPCRAVGSGSLLAFPALPSPQRPAASEPEAFGA